MIIGESDYLKKITTLAMGSNGAASIEYLEGLSIDRVMCINETVMAVTEELKNGK